MPKELIKPRSYGELSGVQVKVGWNAETGDVQLATLAPDGVQLVPHVEANGWYVDMDREAINRLIRVLRRARDQAFGRDE